MRRSLLGGILLAILWFAFGWAGFLLQRLPGSLAALGQIMPSPLRYGVFGIPGGWAVVVQLLMAVALVAAFIALVTWLSPRARTTFASGWLAAILSAFLIGASLDLGNFAVWFGQFGFRGGFGTMGAAPLTTWWAVVVGWIPALVVRGRTGRVDADPAAEADAAPGARAATVTALIAAIALVALPVGAQAGHAAEQEQLRQRAAVQPSPDPQGAAAVDPAADGEPVPTAAPRSTPVAADACTTANTAILAPEADAATGHRLQPLQLVNTSDTPCVVDGYPDVAFGDQNGHLLDATVEHGPSFMAQDPGAQPITLAPGEAVTSGIAWDANSVQGQLAARKLWAAVAAGEARGSWGVVLDIVPGTTVSLSAWSVPARG